QSQINPHFLNNTLEIINWESRMNGNIKVSSMIEALSVMLNATMNRRKQRMISLSEELSYVDAYLLIIKQRLGTRLQVKKEIDHSLLTLEVPRLIIQPIIENAVEHGMDKRNRGEVELKVYREEDKLHIDVINNGVLTDEDKAKIEYLLGNDVDEDKERSVSLGIRNVNRRIKIIYGEEYGLSIYSNEEGYTVSSIVLDANVNEESRYEKETGIDN
ncbi:MAG: histidine kinase, partial [Lachnospiraceae bacterium]|nr:histidine kinase [Lachnospiraceae bacterium]